jgi:hypothetical protein
MWIYQGTVFILHIHSVVSLYLDVPPTLTLLSLSPNHQPKSFDLTFHGATVLKATAGISVSSAFYRQYLALMFM